VSEWVGPASATPTCQHLKPEGDAGPATPPLPPAAAAGAAALLVLMLASGLLVMWCVADRHMVKAAYSSQQLSAAGGRSLTHSLSDSAVCPAPTPTPAARSVRA